MAADEVDFCPHEQFCIILYQLTFLFMDEKFDLMKTWIESLIFPFRLLRIVSWTKYQIAHRSLMDCYSRNVFCSLFCVNIDAKIDWWLEHYVITLVSWWECDLEAKSGTAESDLKCQLSTSISLEPGRKLDCRYLSSLDLLNISANFLLFWLSSRCSTSAQRFNHRLLNSCINLAMSSKNWFLESEMWMN